MSFTGNEDHTISLQDASAWTAAYRAANPQATKGHFFGKAAIEAILNQTGCVGIRLYYAIDTKGQKQIIVVGANANEDDLVNGLLAERSKPCPPYCGTNNALNS